MKFREALRVVCEDPIEVLGAIAFAAGTAGAYIGLYLVGCN